MVTPAVASKAMACVTAKPVTPKPVASIKMMSAEAEKDARTVTIVTRVIAVVIIGVRGSNIATRTVASPVIVADEVHSLQISI